MGNRIPGVDRGVDVYERLWTEMLLEAIGHAQGKELASFKERRQEMMCDARCYILSQKFEDDCAWIGSLNGAIDAARKLWGHESNIYCAVCGQREYRDYYAGEYKVCREHHKIIEAYNNGLDIEKVYASIEREKRRAKNPKYAGCIKVKLTEEQRNNIRKSRSNGKKSTLLAKQYGVSVRTIQTVMKGE